MAKKIKVVRASGLPIDEENLKAYKNEWRDLVDKATLKCRVKNEYKKSVIEPIRMNKLLDRLEKILAKKYELIGEWEATTSQKKWRERVEKYGNITIAAARDSKEVIYIIMDDQGFM